MGRVKVCKEVTFDCAHMLTGHGALCKNLHGHTYKLQVEIINEQIEGGSSADMVLDFKVLKEVIRSEITDKFDHAVIFSGEKFRGAAENDLLEWAKKYSMRYYVMPRRTTAENMAQHFQELVKTELNKNGFASAEVHIRVYETPTSFAEV